MPISIGEVSSTVRTEGEPSAAPATDAAIVPDPHTLAVFRLADLMAEASRTRLAACDEDDR